MRVPIIVGWFLVLVACTEREQAASTQRMAELLEDIAANVDPAIHPYVNPAFLLPTNCCKLANPIEQYRSTGNCRLWSTILGFGILSNC